MTDRDIMKLALEALENLQGLCTDAEDGLVEAVTIWTPEIIASLHDRLAHCDRCGKRLGGEGDIHTCTPKPEPMTEFDEAVAAVDATLHHAIDNWQDRALKAEALLAQPEQEPVVFCMHWVDRWGCNHYADPKEPHPVNAKPLYTTPPQRTEQEPVAWMDIENGTFSGLRYWSEPDNRHEVALYTTTPQRKPLTDEEIIKCWGQVSGTRYGYAAFARAIEAAHGIKEKNNGN